jgi:hypothetical protein
MTAVADIARPLARSGLEPGGRRDGDAGVDVRSGGIHDRASGRSRPGACRAAGRSTPATAPQDGAVGRAIRPTLATGCGRIACR